MRTQSIHIDLFDLIAPLAKTFDMMDPAVADHSSSVAYWTYRLAEALNFPAQEQREMVVAAMLHDIGAFSLQDRMALLQFEVQTPHEHSEAGYMLLRSFPPFENIASTIRFHHVPWEDGAGTTRDGVPVPHGSHLIHLADRLSVLVPREKDVLQHVPVICERIAQQRGRIFKPEYVDALTRLEGKDHIWLDAATGDFDRILRNALASHTQELGWDALIDFSRLICRVIDFKSEFTATHTSGIVATSVALAKLHGFSEEECSLMQVAAYLHDLGKLAIPIEILEKPAALNDAEWHVMRAHVYYTYRVLEPIKEFGVITSWSAMHHERINGSGYPFGHKGEQIPLGARIMAVADVFTAITEDRPYRKAVDRETARAMIARMAERDELDRNVVQILLANFDTLNETRASAQREALHEYQSFRDAVAVKRA
ncbi:MAG: HD domain-containing protein [Candidatus Hydrogenedentes bacterium]|nr:HD domain-containing protein [Candidatus Hydrogenedentota bacterium]